MLTFCISVQDPSVQQVTAQQKGGGLDEYNPFSQENRTTAQPVSSEYIHSLKSIDL